MESWKKEVVLFIFLNDCLKNQKDCYCSHPAPGHDEKPEILSLFLRGVNSNEEFGQRF